jgi:hypothetical protein
MFFNLSPAKQLPLKVSVWVVDEDRYEKLQEQRPDSFVWKFVAMIWICYQNACRSAKQPTTEAIEDIEFKVEEMLSDKVGKAELLGVTSQITAEMQKLFANEQDEEKKIQMKTVAPARKKRTGKR